MRGALLVLVAATIFALPEIAGAQALARPETLRLVDLNPLVVRGIGFKPRERVTVRASGEARTAVRRVVATSVGRFVVRFAEMSYDRCSGLTFTAVGAGGSRAALKAPRPDCPPPLNP